MKIFELLFESYNETEESIDLTEDVYSETNEKVCASCLGEYIKEYSDKLEEAEYQGRKVQLGKPMRGDVKKFRVFVKDPKTGNVKKINFGDPNMRIKKNNPERRKSFRARHKCDQAKDKTTARYWSCKKW